MCRPQIAGKRHMECAYYFLKFRFEPRQKGVMFR